MIILSYLESLTFVPTNHYISYEKANAYKLFVIDRNTRKNITMHKNLSNNYAIFIVFFKN